MPNKKIKMAIGGPSDVETREEYKSRRMADTERGNLNRMEKVSPNPIYKKDDEESRKEGIMRIQKLKQEIKNRRKDPFANG